MDNYFIVTVLAILICKSCFNISVTPTGQATSLRIAFSHFYDCPFVQLLS